MIEAQVAKLRIEAPDDGVIGQPVGEPGEAVIPGEPVITLEAVTRRWVSFNIREDQLGAFRIGSPMRLQPVGGDVVEGRVTEIVPRGEFATWRVARVVGDHDLNTFLVRADPLAASPKLRSGMTVWPKPP